MRKIVLLGINHKTAPVELRECIAFSKEETAAALEALKRHPDISEVLLFSTCNRVEVLLVTQNTSGAVEATTNFISKSNQIPMEQFEKALYIHEGDEAVRHVFRVASSLDSMLVGEPQILGQVKESYRLATVKKTSGVILNRLLHKSFFVAKRVRSETGIGDRAVSISYAAIELGKKIFGSLTRKKILLIGAGEMAELAVENLIRNKAGDIWVANRTFERAVELANGFKGKPVRFEEITACLQQVDIIISSTGAPDLVVTRDHMKGVMRLRKNQPIFFIDIAVPRDIDPEINRMPNAYVYDIDDLKGVIDENIEDRNREAIKGERIVDEAVIRFREWYEGLDVVPTIVALRNKMESIAGAEIKKTLQTNQIPEQGAHAIQKMTNSVINKILHDPTVFLKRDGIHEDKSLYIDTLRKLFKLDD
ncbi:MAG: glutamyl-tRNA reductase [Desulfobacterales bacterium]|nr:MAG: glutamyl-tRNA reductase [Desulfobacterales bacterium]